MYIPEFIVGLFAGAVATVIVIVVIALWYGKNEDGDDECQK